MTSQMISNGFGGKGVMAPPRNKKRARAEDDEDDDDSPTVKRIKRSSAIKMTAVQSLEKCLHFSHMAQDLADECSKKGHSTSLRQNMFSTMSLLNKQTAKILSAVLKAEKAKKK